MDNKEIVEILKQWVNSSLLRETALETAIGELGSIFCLSQSEENYILEIEN